MNSVVFKALGNETRLKIIKTLMIKKHNVTDLTQISGKDQTTISRHLSTLTNSNIIKHKRIGRNIFYSIINAEMNESVLRDKIKDFLNKQKKETYE
jgi:arsenite methyltransferase